MHQHIKLQICKLLDTMLMFFCSVILFSQVRSKSCSKGSCKRREGEGENEKVNSVTFVKSTTFLNYVLLSSHSETTVVHFVWRFRLSAQFSPVWLPSNMTWPCDVKLMRPHSSFSWMLGQFPEWSTCFGNSSIICVELVKDLRKVSPFPANGLKLYLIPLYCLEELPW